MPLQNQYQYDVAISFAGEDRQAAMQFVEKLEARGVSVFYDYNEQAHLWGKDLFEYLSDVYSTKAQFCLMLISKNYLVKPWTRIERRSAFARAFRQPEEYILPLRLDDTEIPGILSTIGYLDIRRLSADEVADQVVVKLKGKAQATTASTEAKRVFNIPLPEVKKSFTQLDRDRFVERSFDEIRAYFQQALSELKQRFPQCETDLREINSYKFLARIYADGALKCACKLWIGNAFGAQMAIQYVEGNRVEIDQDNSFNDYLTVDESGGSLGLKVSPMGIGFKKPDHEVVSSEQAAEYLWTRFTSYLRGL